VIDYNVVSTEDWMNYEENEAEKACYSSAMESGYSIEDADWCDDGDLNCKNCPFKPLTNLKKVV
jgi:hypothetical protein